MIKALICDLGGKGISIIANLLEMAFNTVKSYYLTDLDYKIQKVKKQKY